MQKVEYLLEMYKELKKEKKLDVGANDEDLKQAEKWNADKERLLPVFGGGAQQSSNQWRPIHLCFAFAESLP